ncbi:MAG: P1 family peptidase [Nitrospinota bacterium]
MDSASRRDIPPGLSGCITDVPGFLLGHIQDLEALTGLSVVICPPGTTGACELRGTATATRGLDALRPEHLVGNVDAVVLTGGSAYGLASADGVMSWLEEKGRGFSVGSYTVPTVAAAVLFDLAFGNGDVRPGSAMGRAACEAALDREGPQGSVGAGCGATVGKLLGRARAMKGGAGTASVRLPGGGVVGALAVVNAYGGVHDPDTGAALAGPRAEPPGEGIVDSTHHLYTHGRPFEGFSGSGENTTLGVVATDISLSKPETQKLSQMAANGLIQTVRPSYTTVDGDVVFALSCGEKEESLDAVGAAAQVALSRAICRAVIEADGMGFLPAWRDLR